MSDEQPFYDPPAIGLAVPPPARPHPADELLDSLTDELWARMGRRLRSTRRAHWEDFLAGVLLGMLIVVILGAWVMNGAPK